MELTNEFAIDRGLEETWTVLNDLEFIAPCMPGAQLQEIEGDEYRGIVKVKVGPITAQYKGKATFIEQDAVNKVARMKAEGRDPRQGNANAMITATMEAIDDSQTSVKIHTDLGLSGKIASFGRGAIEDVSKKILGQFTDNLRKKLEETGPVAAAGEEVSSASDPGENAAASVDDAPASANGTTETASAAADDASAAAPSAPTTSGVRKIESEEVEPVDLLAVSSGAMAKRAIPAGAAAIVLAILYWLFSRGQ